MRSDWNETPAQHGQEKTKCHRKQKPKAEQRVDSLSRTSSFSHPIEHQAPSDSPGSYSEVKVTELAEQQGTCVCVGGGVCVWAGRGLGGVKVESGGTTRG